jgi:hypothetical protein
LGENIPGEGQQKILTPTGPGLAMLAMRLRYLARLTPENCLIFITSDGFNEESCRSQLLSAQRRNRRKWIGGSFGTHLEILS